MTTLKWMFNKEIGDMELVDVDQDKDMWYGIY